MPHGKSYWGIRSINGSGFERFAGPTPQPSHLPVANSSMVITGPTAAARLRPAHHSVSCTIRYRPLDTDTPAWPCRLACPVIQVPAHVLPDILSPRCDGSGRQAATTSRGATSEPLTRIFCLLSRPSIFKVFSTLMKRSPRPYLNVTRLHLIQRGTSTSSLLHVDDAHRPDATGKFK